MICHWETACCGIEGLSLTNMMMDRNVTPKEARRYMKNYMCISLDLGYWDDVDWSDPYEYDYLFGFYLSESMLATTKGKGMKEFLDSISYITHTTDSGDMVFFYSPSQL